MKVFNIIASFPFIALIKIFQYAISPFIPNSCRYSPSCSVYSVQAFVKHGVFKGFFLMIRRIIWCNPWGGHGNDEVPERFYLTKKLAIKNSGAANYNNYINFRHYFKTLKSRSDEEN